MEDQDRNVIIAVALMAALADGQATAQEKAELQSAMTRAGTGRSRRPHQADHDRSNSSCRMW